MKENGAGSAAPDCSDSRARNRGDGFPCARPANSVESASPPCIESQRWDASIQGPGHLRSSAQQQRTPGIARRWAQFAPHALSAWSHSRFKKISDPEDLLRHCTAALQDDRYGQWVQSPRVPRIATPQGASLGGHRPSPGEGWVFCVGSAPGKRPGVGMVDRANR